MAKFKNSVGRGCPNHPEDVIKVVGQFKEILPANGGFKGLGSQPALAPAEQGTYVEFLGDVIARFQSMHNLNWEYKNQQGKIGVGNGIGGSTWQKMVAMAGKPAVAPPAAKPQAVTASLTALAGAQGDKQSVETSETAGDLDWFIKALTGGKKTQWILGGTGGFGAGAGVLNVQAGSINLVRPDGTDLSYALAGAGLGVSVAEASVSYSGSSFPSGSGTIYRGRLAKAVELTDDHFAGKLMMLSASVTLGSAGATVAASPGAGGGISLCFFGMQDAYWGSLQDRFKEKDLSKAAARALFGNLIADAMERSCAVAGIWGTQIGTMDAGIGISLCAAIPKERLNWFGFRSILLGFGGAILTED